MALSENIYNMKIYETLSVCVVLWCFITDKADISHYIQ